MKRNLSQKLIAIFLALGMLLSLAPTVLAADEPLAASEEISDEAASAETDATGDDTPNKDLIVHKRKFCCRICIFKTAAF